VKDRYFTTRTIDKVARGMLVDLQSLRAARPMDFVPRKAALLVIDMQGYFLDESSHAFVPSAVPIVERVVSLGRAFNKTGRPVILTRHLNTERDAGSLAEWWADLIREGDSLSEIVPEITVLDGMVLRKTQYDAFHRTRLEEMLREKKVEQVVATGVLTHLCVETTARAAFVRGFKVYLPLDATASYAEEFHRAAALNLSHGFALPVLTGELQEILEAADGGR